MLLSCELYLVENRDLGIPEVVDDLARCGIRINGDLAKRTQAVKGQVGAEGRRVKQYDPHQFDQV